MLSKMGYALTALREDEDAAKEMGIDVTKYKIIAFITSASLVGLVGAFAWALKLTHIFPDEVFEILYTIECIVIVLLGETGTRLGPAVGETCLRPLQIFAYHYPSWISTIYIRTDYYYHSGIH